MISEKSALAVLALGLLSISVAAATDCYQCSNPWQTSYVSQYYWPQCYTYPCSYQNCYDCDYSYQQCGYYPYNYYYYTPYGDCGCQYGYNYPCQYSPYRY